MNLSEIKIDHTQYKGAERLKVVFEMQDELRQLYKIPILNLDVPEDQTIAREFAWCIIEELGETIEVQTGTQDREHILDEIADAFSFYIELFIVCGINWNDLEMTSHRIEVGDLLDGWYHLDNTKTGYKSTLRNSHSFFAEKLALAINRLKNRKWRKTNLQTNEFLFRKDLVSTFIHFIRLCKELKISSFDLFDSYLRKHQVNKFRLNSNY